jgi:exosome complex component RRP42
MQLQVLDSSGNLFEAISVGIRAALANTLIPKAKVSADMHVEIVDDLQAATRLPLRSVPICVTLARVRRPSIFSVDMISTV